MRHLLFEELERFDCCLCLADEPGADERWQSGPTHFGATWVCLLGECAVDREGDEFGAINHR
ncbi:MAG: hypothetical protein CML31_05320 [Rhizobiales bacterium]|nr:hypothetical protein [Hoeflea sp.]MBG19373.1 hypothetical protein [Hyphomicrobiales bacterium]|tara:strand:+ start:314 stop:499 length:186 start_codon:yes stop_codon:yes gene_type:complete